MKEKNGLQPGKLLYLNEKNAPLNPFLLFEDWYNASFDHYNEEANIMALSTMGVNNFPSSRIVLLKGFSDKGFVFFTNYHSRKGLEIAENPLVSLLFYWPLYERQIRIEGSAEKINPELSDKYFASRPRDSKIGALISPQSQVVPDRKFLENKFTEAEYTFPDEIPRPFHWGGYIVKPSGMEFWQGRPGRLHDRLLYTLRESEWIISRLAP